MILWEGPLTVAAAGAVASAVEQAEQSRHGRYTWLSQRIAVSADQLADYVLQAARDDDERWCASQARYEAEIIAGLSRALQGG